MENDKKFTSEMFGYSKKEVEEYLKDMKADYEGRLQVENNQLIVIADKLSFLTSNTKEEE